MKKRNKKPSHNAAPTNPQPNAEPKPAAQTPAQPNTQNRVVVQKPIIVNVPKAQPANPKGPTKTIAQNKKPKTNGYRQISKVQKPTLPQPETKIQTPSAPVPSQTSEESAKPEIKTELANSGTTKEPADPSTAKDETTSNASSIPTTDTPKPAPDLDSGEKIDDEEDPDFVPKPFVPSDTISLAHQDLPDNEPYVEARNRVQHRPSVDVKLHNDSTASSIFFLLLRIIVAGLFILAGALKITDPEHFLNEILSFHILPYWAAYASSLVVPWLELFGGIMLLTFSFTCAASLILSILTLGFLFIMAAAHRMGMNADCGCFGDWMLFGGFKTHMLINSCILLVLLLHFKRSCALQRLLEKGQ